MQLLCDSELQVMGQHVSIQVPSWRHRDATGVAMVSLNITQTSYSSGVATPGPTRAQALVEFFLYPGKTFQ